MKDNLQKIVIIGPGRMGLGIALTFSLNRFRVEIVDVKDRPAAEYEVVTAKAREELRSRVKFLKKVGYTQMSPKEVLPYITFSKGITREHLSGACIFEALPEKPDLKIKLFEDISPFIGPRTVVASTTSTIDIRTLAKGLKNPERLVITHWLNPAFIIPVVEVAHADTTDPRAVSRTKRLLKRIGKMPVMLKDSPGFIIPRIQSGAMNEAVRILEEGIASAEDIDTAIRYGFGFRLSVLGLLEFIDLGGLDILYYTDQFLYSAYRSDHLKAPRLIEEKMKKGQTGIRAGQGIYNYENVDVNKILEKVYSGLIDVLRAKKKTSQGG